MAARQVKIKTGVVKRLGKELTMYEKDVAKEQERFDKIIVQSEDDEYKKKKQAEVIQECKAAIPDCKKRLTAAVAELKNLLASEEGMEETEEGKAAKEVLDGVADQL